MPRCNSLIDVESSIVDRLIHLRASGGTAALCHAEAALCRFLLHPSDGTAGAELHGEDVHEAASCNVVAVTNDTQVIMRILDDVVAPIGAIEV